MMNLKEFCINVLDNMYTPNIPFENQCNGYKTLIKMLEEGIEPASEEEILRWETNPTQEELLSIPHLKYLRAFHPLIRPVLIKHWETIKNMRYDKN